MWQASLDIGPESVRLVLTNSGTGFDPRFVSAREWSLSVGRNTIAHQLYQWEREHDMKLDGVVCDADAVRLFSLEWSSVVVDDEQANSMTDFWRTLTLPPQWHRGIVLAMLGAHQRQGSPWRDDPESWVLTWLHRRLMEVEAFLYGDDEFRLECIERAAE